MSPSHGGARAASRRRRRPIVCRAITEPLFRSRSGALIAALTFSTLATGVLLISIPLELRQLHAAPGEIGVTLSMFGFGMFAFEWLWGVIADRAGYRAPLVASQLLYGASIVLLGFAGTVPQIAVTYFFACGMMVAVGPIARSYVGTALHSRLRATGLALLAAQWVLAEALGSGAGGQLIDRVAIRDVVLGAAAMPLLSAALCAWVFHGYSHAAHRRAHAAEAQAAVEAGGQVTSAAGVLAVTAAIVLLVQVGIGGEVALLPLLVTTRLGLSASSAGTAMLAVGLVGGALLVPGGSASDRWGRRPTMVLGGLVSALGFAVYAMAGGLPQVLAGAALRAVGASLIWPAATAWIAESVPARRHALFMGLFGEFENVGITLGPVLGGLAWSWFGIQSAFYVYAVAAVLAAAVAGIAVRAGRAQAAPEALSF